MRDYGISTILVPVDFSPISRHALSHAERIGRRTRARITLLNVVEPVGGAFGTSGMLSLSSTLEKKALEASARKLRHLGREAAKRSGVRVQPMVLVGKTASTICTTARKIRADLIVMGTHGASGFMENLLGSTTYRVTSVTRIPVLSVHKKISRQGYSHIIYPVREHAHIMKKFPHALKFARLFRAGVRILGPTGTGKAVQVRCRALMKKFAARGIPADVSFTSESFFPDAAIRHARTRRNSLVVIVQDADFHLVEVFQGSFTKRMLHAALSPVLVVPGETRKPRT